MYDLFDKPIEGFIKGPIEGGIGITKGVGSLVKNTVSGTSNSAGKISGAIAGGFSTISMVHILYMIIGSLLPTQKRNNEDDQTSINL